MISNLVNIICILNPYGIKRKENVNQITLYVALKDYTNRKTTLIAVQEILRTRVAGGGLNSAQLELVLQ